MHDHGSHTQGQMHENDKKNLIIFIVAALAVWFAFDHYLLKPRLTALNEARQVEQQAALEARDLPEGALQALAERPRADVVAEGARLRIDNGRVSGSIALTGGRIDDLILPDHYKNFDQEENVELLSPAGAPFPKYVEFGWMPADEATPVPGRTTRWQIDGPQVLSAEGTVTLYWDNGRGLRFERQISLDEHYMFTVTQRVINNGTQSAVLYPYALIREHGKPEDLFGRFIIHEGPISYIDGDLTEYSYRKMSKEGRFEKSGREGWIGITQNYWLTSLIPAQAEDTKFRFIYTKAENDRAKERYQADIMGQARTIPPGGGTGESVVHAYLGAKDVNLIGQYERELGVRHFDLTVDFGLFYFMTKPFYHILTWLGSITGNFGIGIIILTVLIRIAVFPLANTSFKSFARLKQIAPRMTELREKYGDDKQKLQQELVKLYEREKVNPMAGCLPILIQIPIFFALFKVLQLSLEMRHAPFFGWIQDLSAPDPTSIFNLFGLLPFDPPAFLMIGAWPCIMLLFMIAQKKMNPPPQDKTQAMMMNFMPFMITFILAKFSAGLVIYWTFSNALSVLQQYVIMRNMGVEVHWFKRSKDEKDMAQKVAEGPSVHPELGVVEDEVEKALFEHQEDEEGEDKGKKTPAKKSVAKKSAKKAPAKKSAAKKSAKKAGADTDDKKVTPPKPKKSKKKK